LKTYSYATCDVTLTHDENAVGVVKTLSLTLTLSVALTYP